MMHTLITTASIIAYVTIGILVARKMADRIRKWCELEYFDNVDRVMCIAAGLIAGSVWPIILIGGVLYLLTRFDAFWFPAHERERKLESKVEEYREFARQMHEEALKARREGNQKLANAHHDASLAFADMAKDLSKHR